jgi:hypothetical protein
LLGWHFNFAARQASHALELRWRESPGLSPSPSIETGAEAAKAVGGTVPLPSEFDGVVGVAVIAVAEMKSEGNGYEVVEEGSKTASGPVSKTYGLKSMTAIICTPTLQQTDNLIQILILTLILIRYYSTNAEYVRQR